MGGGRGGGTGCSGHESGWQRNTASPRPFQRWKATVRMTREYWMLNPCVTVAPQAVFGVDLRACGERGGITPIYTQ